MADELLDLIEKFEPNSERYVEHLLRVRITKFRTRRLAATAVAWFPSLSLISSIKNPLKFDDRSRLSEIVWLTDDKRLVKRENVPGWNYCIVDPKDFTDDDRQRLIMGLKGDFDAIDKQFHERGQKYLKEHLDEVVNKTRREALIIQLAIMSPDDPRYASLHEEALTSLLV